MSQSTSSVSDTFGTDDAITVSSDKVQGFAFRSCFQDSFQGTILAKYAADNLDAKKQLF